MIFLLLYLEFSFRRFSGHCGQKKDDVEGVVVMLHTTCDGCFYKGDFPCSISGNGTRACEEETCQVDIRTIEEEAEEVI